MSNVKLKPCPFCGGEAILDREDIFCDDCHLSMRIDDRVYNREVETFEKAREQAIQDWNTRKPMDNIIEEVARRDPTDGTVKVFSGKEVIDIIKKGGMDND